MLAKSQRLKTILLSLAILELAAFILVASWLGFGNTLVILILCSVIGVAWLQRLGVNLNQSLRPEANMRAMQLQPEKMIAAILFIIPGFITALLGLLLLIPALRRTATRFKFFSMIPQPFQTKAHPHSKPHSDSHAGDNNVIEGEFKREDSDQHQSSDHHSKK